MLILEKKQVKFLKEVATPRIGENASLDKLVDFPLKIVS